MNCELTTCLPRCRQKDRGIAESRALVAESWFLFVCSVVLPHLRSSRLIIVQPLPLNLLPPPPSFLHSFWFCVTASPHLRELSKSSVFVFRCLPRNVFLSSPAHKLICIQTHTYTWTYRESSSKITENLDYILFFSFPVPDDDPPCVLLVSLPLLSPILVLQNPCCHSLLANF